MLKRIITVFFVIFLLFSFSACIGAPAASEPVKSTPLPAPTREATPKPTPTPDPGPDTQKLAQSFIEEWKKQTLTLEFPEDFFGNKPEKYVMNTKLDRSPFVKLTDDIKHELSLAAERAVPECGYPAVVQKYEADINWQMAYALIFTAQNADDAVRKIMASMEPNAVFTYTDGTVYVSLTQKDINYKERLALSGSKDAAFMYCYSNTLFDENGDVCEYVLPEAEGSLKEGIVWPLASHTRLRKTWYADRDGGKRRHTGTDIWADEGVEIYSCTSGTVTGVYYSDKSGNAVVVTDDYGYEFHYYHMVTLTDFLAPGDRVEAGDLIGHVGNTGNSSLDHLHLTIISDDGVLINPYPYLLEVRP